MEDIKKELQALFKVITSQPLIKHLPNAVYALLKGACPKVSPKDAAQFAVIVRELNLFFTELQGFWSIRGGYRHSYQTVLEKLAPLFKWTKEEESFALAEACQKVDKIVEAGALAQAKLDPASRQRVASIKHEVAWAFWVTHFGDKTVAPPTRVWRKFRQFVREQSIFPRIEREDREQELIYLLDSRREFAVTGNSLSQLLTHAECDENFRVRLDEVGGRLKDLKKTLKKDLVLQVAKVQNPACQLKPMTQFRINYNRLEVGLRESSLKDPPAVVFGRSQADVNFGKDCGFVSRNQFQIVPDLELQEYFLVCLSGSNPTVYLADSPVVLRPGLLFSTPAPDLWYYQVISIDIEQLPEADFDPDGPTIVAKEVVREKTKASTLRLKCLSGPDKDKYEILRGNEQFLHLRGISIVELDGEWVLRQKDRLHPVRVVLKDSRAQALGVNSARLQMWIRMRIEVEGIIFQVADI